MRGAGSLPAAHGDAPCRRLAEVVARGKTLDQTRSHCQMRLRRGKQGQESVGRANSGGGSWLPNWVSRNVAANCLAVSSATGFSFGLGDHIHCACI